VADPYVSQLELPASSGRPQVPSALANVYDPAIQFTHQASHALVEQGKVQEQLDGLTAGEQILQNVFNSATAKAQELADPGSDPTSFDPRQRKADYNKFVQSLLQAASRDAEKVGGTGQKYVTYHLSNILNPALTKFNTEMDKRWNEKNNFDLNQTLTNLSQQAVASSSAEEVEAVIARGQDLIGAQVLAGRKTDEQGAAMYKTFRFNTYYNRVIAKVRKEPGKFLLDSTTITASDLGIPQDVFDQVFEKASAEYNQLMSMQDRNAKANEDALRELRNQNYMADASRLDPTMGDKALTRTEVETKRARGMYTPEQYDKLITGLHAIRDAGGLGDPVRTANLVKQVEMNPFQPIPSVAGLNGPQIAKVYDAQAKAMKRQHDIDDDVEHPFHSQQYKSREASLVSLKNMVQFSMERPDAVNLVNDMLYQYQTMVGAYYKANPGKLVPFDDIYNGLMDSFAGPLERQFGLGVDLRTANRAEGVKQLQRQLQAIYSNRELDVEQMNAQAKNIREALSVIMMLAPAEMPRRNAP
jgi:hypothetical protein